VFVRTYSEHWREEGIKSLRCGDLHHCALTSLSNASHRTRAMVCLASGNFFIFGEICRDIGTSLGDMAGHRDAASGSLGFPKLRVTS